MLEYYRYEIVKALKISGIEIKKDGRALIASADREIAPLRTMYDFSNKFKGCEDDMGYYIKRPDNTEAWLSASEFNDEYTRL
jgi:hypothetical protein